MWIADFQCPGQSSDLAHSGNAGDLWHQCAKKSARIVLFELGWRQTNAEGQSARWINSYSGRLKFQKTPKHQSRAYQQDECQGHFCHDQTVADALTFAAPKSAAAAFFDRIDQLRTRCLQRREQSKQHC